MLLNFLTLKGVWRSSFISVTVNPRLNCSIQFHQMHVIFQPPRPVGPRYSDRGEENEYLRENSVSSQTSPPPRQQTRAAVFEDPPPAYNDIIR